MMTVTTVLTSRFGQISFEEEDLVVFNEGLVGLPSMCNYVFIQHREGSPFRWMQSVDDGTVAFLVVNPAEYVKDFNPEMPESAACALEMTEETPRLVYTICNIPKGNPKGMTLNLAGPIIINCESRCARQVVLDSDSYPVKFQVFHGQAAEAA